LQKISEVNYVINLFFNQEINFFVKILFSIFVAPYKRELIWIKQGNDNKGKKVNKIDQGFNNSLVIAKAKSSLKY